jgi:LytS/YehU family sensor histidine kinase
MGYRTPLAQRIGWRQSVWLTLGLWGFTYLTFLMPSFADHGGMAWYGYPIIAAAVLPGLLLAMPLYLLVWASRDWPVAPRVALVGGVAAMAAWCHSMLDASIVLALRQMVAPETVAPVTIERLVDKFLSYVWIYELYATAIGLILSAALAQDRERRHAATLLAARGAELATLRQQVNPHFLFNTLNAISGLIVTGRAARADEMLGRLSGYLRASLDGGAGHTVALEREIETVAAYLDIEGARFGDRLRFEVACPPDLADVAVPAFILQPLIENAVKHGVGGSSAPVTIRLVAAADGGRLSLAVTDDGRAAGPADAPGAGLQALRSRLEILYGGEAALEAGPALAGYAAAIVLPLSRGRQGSVRGARRGA